jgi:hypothetical protein
MKLTIMFFVVKELANCIETVDTIKLDVSSYAEAARILRKSAIDAQHRYPGCVFNGIIKRGKRTFRIPLLLCANRHLNGKQLAEVETIDQVMFRYAIPHIFTSETRLF